MSEINSKKRTLEEEDSLVDESVKSKVSKIGAKEEVKSGEAISKASETKEGTTDEKEKDTKKEKPGSTAFVFGSTTSFGNMGGFKMFANNGKNAFATHKVADDEVKDTKSGLENSGSKSESKDGKEGDKDPKEEKVELDNKSGEKGAKEKDEEQAPSESEASSETKKLIFGSGSSFANVFQSAMNKKSIFDSLESRTDKNQDAKPLFSDTAAEATGSTTTVAAAGTSLSSAADETSTKDVYKKVHLEKQDVRSGEENEETIFQIKAKLYHMDVSKTSSGWKERGFGIIKVNKFKTPPADNYTSRLVMRQNGNLKLILNVPIIKGFNVLKGMPSSLSANKFIRLPMLENGEPVQYAIKIGQPENAELLFNTIEKQVPK